MAPDSSRRKRKISNKSNSREKDRKHEKLEARHDETLKYSVKSQDHKQTVSDLVYQYLGNLANVNDRRKQRHNARSIFHRAHIRKQPRDLHPDRHRVDLSSVQISNSNLKLNFPQYLPLTYENTFSRYPRSSASEEIVADYSKAVNEVRNAARKYICKALSFAVHSGFLVPADNRGQILRVSSNLCLFQTAKNMKREKTAKKVRYDSSSLKK
ncbi:uncharacterized protein LOC117167647 [Belonocnema kinseyi]|uniref:uncharacterized protein LOC117167647 n=1 Tax=Belonocnema kinseyi TaxID=2817044 RepID=UPI00143D2115|nr:uncharacterized protein LOC117167647 [Belonocnema kinseyi]